MVTKQQAESITQSRKLQINEELIAITEGKQKDFVAGFIQNVKVLITRAQEKGNRLTHSICLTISMGS